MLVIFGLIGWASGFNIVKFLFYIKEEIVVVLATSSSDPALPTLMAKMEKLGCSKSLVGLVVPTGYTFNTDGSSLYMTMAALFVAQATNIHLTVGQQLTIFAVAVLTSKGASGVTGAAFIALVATLMVIPTIPVAGMALLIGIDRFMSMARAVVNMIGNGVATLGGSALGTRTRQGNCCRKIWREGCVTGSCSAGVSPAVLRSVKFREIAGGTPALQHMRYFIFASAMR